MKTEIKTIYNSETDKEIPKFRYINVVEAVLYPGELDVFSKTQRSQDKLVLFSSEAKFTYEGDFHVFDMKTLPNIPSLEYLRSSVNVNPKRIIIDFGNCLGEFQLKTIEVAE